MNLRPYQTEASVAIREAWLTHASVMVVMATGTGKTVLAADIIRDAPGDVLFLAHRQELIYQARDRIQECTGIPCGIEMGDERVDRDHKFKVIVSSVQTQCAGGAEGNGRMTRFDPMRYSRLIYDECFPAGTLVDGIPIESLRPGMRVLTGDGTKHRITRCFRQSASSLLRLSFKSGKQLICTPNHPILVQTGRQPEWQPASSLKTNDSIFRHYAHANLPDLRNPISTCRPSKKTLLQTMPQRGFEKIGEKHEPALCLGANEGQQSHVETWGQGSNGCHAATNRPLPTNPRRQWASADRTAANLDRSAGRRMGKRVGNTHENGAPQRLSRLLQGGYWECVAESCDRNRRVFSLCAFPPRTRHQEGGFLGIDRVDSIEVLESGSDGTFDGMCPGGWVYNLAIDQSPTYFANGVLVHNCHHCPAQTYRRISRYYGVNPNLKILGITATPDRADKLALGEVFTHVAYKYEIYTAISDGFLVPIDQQFVQVDGLDLSKVKTTAGDLNSGQLSAIIEAEKVLYSIAGPAIDLIGDKRTIGFTPSVKSAQALAEIFNRHKSGMAGWLCGKTKDEDRKKVLAAFAAGEIQVILNVGILSEGYDHPQVEAIIMGRPTKSRALYGQHIGRAMRALAGVVDGWATAEERRAAIAASAKPRCLILDFVGNSGKHKLVSVADVLGGKASPEVVARAVRDARNANRAVDMTEALLAAERDLQLEKEEQERLAAARRAHLQANTTYSLQKVNPFGYKATEYQGHFDTPTRNGLSDGQRKVLLREGIDPESISAAHGKRLVGEIIARLRLRPATPGQIRILQSRGKPTNVTCAEASKMINEIALVEHWKPKV